MKKILIAYATAGIGHKKASVAIKKALDEMAPEDTKVVLIDALDYTPAFFKWTYLKLYLLAVNKLSHIWGFMYYLTDNFYVNLIVAPIRRINNWMNSKRLEAYLVAEKPDVIISTHFFLSEVVSDLKERKRMDSYLMTVVTDYRLHSWWVAPKTDKYIVGSREAKADLLRWNVPESKVSVMGIPAEPVFAKKLDRSEMRRKFGLEEALFTVLVIGGGFGVGPIEGIVKSLAGVNKPLQAVVICGHNEELVKRMEALRSALGIKLKVLGFVDNVYEYMDAADVLISKSGGITATEALNKELPMIVIAPIPGQETRNCDFLMSNGAGVKIGALSDLKDAVEGLITNPEKLSELKKAIGNVRSPRACYDIADAAVALSCDKGRCK